MLLSTFSPLFIGARIVTLGDVEVVESEYSSFSPLFIGARIVTKSELLPFEAVADFQSPFHRGKDCNATHEDANVCTNYTFSPLFIGARIVTGIKYWKLGLTLIAFQSPFHRGKDCNWCKRRDLPFHRLDLSVPFSSGQGL